MGHSQFEIRDADVRFEASRLGALVDEAKKRGYLEDIDPESEAADSPEVEALES